MVGGILDVRDSAGGGGAGANDQDCWRSLEED